MASETKIGELRQAVAVHNSLWWSALRGETDKEAFAKVRVVGSIPDGGRHSKECNRRHWPIWLCGCRPLSAPEKAGEAET